MSDSRPKTDEADEGSFNTARIWRCMPSTRLSPCIGPPRWLASSNFVCVRM